MITFTFLSTCPIAQAAVLAIIDAMATPSLRERNKSDKLQRIQAAARALFAGRGFDATSTREIAAQANVGLATLFLYASGKRDLLFLACNDDLEALTACAFASIDADAPILDQLVEVFGHFFEFYGRDRQLSRDLLRELTFYTSGRQSARFQATRQATIDAVARLVGDARGRGQFASPARDDEIAQVIFYVFAAEVRRWLARDDVSADGGLAHFRRLLGVVVTGLRQG